MDVEIAVINKGSQAELIRGIVLIYDGNSRSFRREGKRVAKGDTEVIRAELDQDMVLTSKPSKSQWA